MIFDSHVHINVGVGTGIGTESSSLDCKAVTEAVQFEELLKTKGLGVLANAADVSEYEALQQIEGVNISFGIHPWSADEFCKRDKEGQMQISEQIGELKPYFQKADAVGEIGMDSVWCQCDLKLQKALFVAQLDMAEALGKPVVLHTKGQEAEIAEILQNYSMRKLVHWYSCDEHLEKFINQDCYFTIGPDFAGSSAVKAVIEKVKISRLLVETDGINAVEWAVGRNITPGEIPKILTETVKAIAKAKDMTVKTAEAAMEENFHRFVG